MSKAKSAYSIPGKKGKLDTHIIVVWVDNEASVLSRVVGLFSGRGYNIESLAVAEVDQKLDAYHAGFVLGPRVNAGGRVGDSGLGVRLLTTNDSGEADACAVLLNNYNMERQTIEKVVQEAALEQAFQQVEDNRPLILVAGKDWHPGVIGIVAGRLRERFNLPAFVVSLSNGLGKGSGRSIKGVTLGSAVLAANQALVLLRQRFWQKLVLIFLLLQQQIVF